MASMYRLLGRSISRVSLNPTKLEATWVEFTKQRVTKNEDIEILIPKLDRSGAIPLTVARLEQFIKTQSRFYRAAHTPQSGALEKKIQAEVRAVQQVFPTIDDDKLLSAAMAWFALLCAIDDEIDKLRKAEPTAEVDATLNCCISVLETAITRSGPAPPKPEVRESRTELLTSAFVNHTRKLLAREVHHDFLIAALKHWQICKQETHWRNQGSIPEEDYLVLRRETIGVTPLFTLLLHHYGCSTLALEERKVFHRMLGEARTVVVLQNDIVGLERDMSDKDVLNFMLIHGDFDLEVVKSQSKKAAELHNNAMLAVDHCWNTIHSGKRANEKAFANSLVVFLQQHFLWAIKAKRYKPESAPRNSLAST